MPVLMWSRLTTILGKDFLRNDMSSAEKINVLGLALHGEKIGYLTGYKNGRNIFTFAPEFRENSSRSTFTLTTHPNFPNVERVLAEPWSRRQRLHPVLSNLLPEGALRELIAQYLKIHTDNEFGLLTRLGEDLPGALIATPEKPEDIPGYVLPLMATAVKTNFLDGTKHFSLAGVQMKFSMLNRDGRYRIAESGDLGDWIIKTPSTRHKLLPLNEFTAMRLAQMAGIDIPDIKLVKTETIDKIPAINLPDEEFAFAIRRFDRAGKKRIHSEDFAQVLAKYPQQKYDGPNYEQIGKIIYQYTGDGLRNAQQFARRLLVNILLANGDAHLKNWSLIYPDTITPELSPAYDMVITRVYMGDEREYALNLARNKDWYKTTFSQFKAWADKAGIPWKAIKPQLDDTLNKARSLWPKSLEGLPADHDQKKQLREHWRLLSADFRIETAGLT